MKIDDFIRTSLLKSDVSIKKNTDIETGSLMDSSNIIANAASETEISLPDLLQAFGRQVARRQEMSDSLPASIRSKLAEVLRSSQDESASTNIFEHATIQQGVTGLVRENRILSGVMRLLVSELEFIERAPEFMENLTVSGDANNSSTPAVTSSTASPVQLTSLKPEVLQDLVNEGLNRLASVTEGTGQQQFASLPSPISSLTGRFEWLITSLATRPESWNSLLNLLPEVMSTVKSALSDRTGGKITAPAYEKLAQSAPKWLMSMADQENKPELLEFWVAAKAADIIPWAKLGQTQRQQSMETLKELASTYDQPELFRTPGEDSASRGLMFQIALYVPGQEKPHPALVQIYEENKDRGNAQPPEQEVWIRVSLDTDHIGTVDLSFRLQNKKYLTIFSRFADLTVASEFQACLPEIRQELAATSIELKKIAVTQQNSTGVMEDG